MSKLNTDFLAVMDFIFKKGKTPFSIPLKSIFGAPPVPLLILFTSLVQ